MHSHLHFYFIVYIISMVNLYDANDESFATFMENKDEQ